MANPARRPPVSLITGGYPSGAGLGGPANPVGTIVQLASRSLLRCKTTEEQPRPQFVDLVENDTSSSSSSSEATTQEMRGLSQTAVVVKALFSINNPDGSTAMEIKNFIQSNYGTEIPINTLRRILGKGLGREFDVAVTGRGLAHKYLLVHGIGHRSTAAQAPSSQNRVSTQSTSTTQVAGREAVPPLLHRRDRSRSPLRSPAPVPSRRNAREEGAATSTSTNSTPVRPNAEERHAAMMQDLQNVNSALREQLSLKERQIETLEQKMQELNEKLRIRNQFIAETVATST